MLEWKDEFLVGHEEIDIQHRKLIELLNLFVESLEESNMTQLSAEILPQLLICMKDLFSSEEKLMLSIKYIDYHRHKLFHDSMNKKMTVLLMRMKKSKKINVQESMEALYELLIEHFQKEDKNIAVAKSIKNTAGISS